MDARPSRDADEFGASKSQNVTVDSSEVRRAGPARVPSVRTSPDFESFQNHISFG
jgi:hypothetical protein